MVTRLAEHVENWSDGKRIIVNLGTMLTLIASIIGMTATVVWKASEIKSVFESRSSQIDSELKTLGTHCDALNKAVSFHHANDWGLPEEVVMYDLISAKYPGYPDPEAVFRKTHIARPDEAITRGTP